MNRKVPENPFKFRTCILNRTEYAKVISKINTNYELYKGKAYAVHYSVGTNNRYYVYYFENYGFNDYNIVEKFEL